MDKKVIDLDHHKDDYECMWNGIEDVYITKTKEKIPNFYFFVLAGIGNFVYFKSKNGNMKRFASWSDGRTKSMYKWLAPIVGFSYKHIEGRSFSYVLKKSKQQIDEGNPVVIGNLDMYYLKYYPKFYKQLHIPTHYVLMVGYDEDKREVIVHDCGLDNPQSISYELLEKALDIDEEAGNKKNTICYLEFGKLADVNEISRKALALKAADMLEKKPIFLGISGMRKLAKEFSTWKEELSEDEYKVSLATLVTFTGTVPTLPDKLVSEEAKTGVLHQAAREKIIHVLEFLRQNYDFKDFDKAIKCFEKSAIFIEKMTDMISDYLLDDNRSLDLIPRIILEIADEEERAYRIIQESLKKPL
ncbi:hypothetical protein M2475_001586 [Breznakia sp. PF5-3]|uniref:BtrH N-terminal domain-containing protein n=1 Tax=unclassified Breznakia TaxID=2623764 RepID=UPI00240708A8|nr:MULTISPECIES: BtrH N-terminal domain-containing protein [unclassified Breznakia]MDF9825129.1 hypothetical protein [Breznakia sp. PM6-1]MDF9836012.1 hypothetical protein [Breznakia sp. PF5-3]MDF9838110.1 hypothetical protein [Breznakia sp. PFB2-8]MDF9860060.1 hypothetical protein [Breznakia sp. PH5-24]